MVEPNLRYFLPYQLEWLKDENQVKIWEKSRRIGATYVQSFEDVLDSIKGKYPAVWFSSADESAAKEYILYCSQWAKLYDMPARDMGEVVIDSKKDIKALQIKFKNDVRINALTSNPKAFRSKGGKVIWDEAAHHDNDVEMWKAAKPTATWGFPIRILSTHNGTQTMFYRFVEQIKKGKLAWSLHTTDIHKAVEDGLVDKIYGRATTLEERTAWLKQQEADCFDRWTWLEEFCCIPVDEASAFLSYDELAKIELDNCLLDNLKDVTGDLFVGFDVGRRKDLSVIWVIERLGNVNYTRYVQVMEQAKFQYQFEVMSEIMKHPKFRRAEIDETGLGMQLAEQLQDAFGKMRVEKVFFTQKVKEELAYILKRNVEEIRLRIPADKNIREDFHSIRKVTTASNNIRFDVAQSEVSGHADRFWACALANHAAEDTTSGPLIITSRKMRMKKSYLDNF